MPGQAAPQHHAVKAMQDSLMRLDVLQLQHGALRRPCGLKCAFLCHAGGLQMAHSSLAWTCLSISLDSLGCRSQRPVALGLHDSGQRMCLQQRHGEMLCCNGTAKLWQYVCTYVVCSPCRPGMKRWLRASVQKAEVLCSKPTHAG